MNHPPDRSHLTTEQRNPHSMDLHALSVAGLIGLIHGEDRTVLDAMDRARPALTAFIEQVEPRFAAGGRLVYLGAGTSGRLGVLDASEAPPTFCVESGRIIGIIAGGDTALRRSSEGAEDDPHGARDELNKLQLNERDTVVGIASGGTTPYVLGGLAEARRINAAVFTGLIVCTPIDPPESVDHLIVIETGPEVLTGSTRMKAGTATKMALNIISTTLMVRSGRVYENLMVDLRATNDKLRDRAARIITMLTPLDRTGAFDLLDRAGGSVKTAIVMHELNLPRPEAEQRLAACANHLARALGHE